MLNRPAFVPVARIGRSLPEGRIAAAAALPLLLCGLGSGPAQAGAPVMPIPCGGGLCARAPAGTGFVGNPVNAAHPEWTASTSWNAANNTLTVNQTVDKAILNWDSFNVGSNVQVHFAQPGAGSATLNRIWQASPTLIQGQITAPGQVFLVNQNGIVFGQGAQVSVGGLLASTLDINTSAFLNSLFDPANNGNGPLPLLSNGGAAGSVVVQAGALLQTTGTGGRILLAGTQVSNAGSLITPDGQTVLAAGDHIYVSAPDNQNLSLRGIQVAVDASPGSGVVSNLGQILAERGNITLAGLTVNQQGSVRATTSVNFNGSIYLVAGSGAINPNTLRLGTAPQQGGTLTLAGGSVTEVAPDLKDSSTAVDTQVQLPGVINLAAANIQLQSGARVTDHGGQVSVTARANLDVSQEILTPATAPGNGLIYIDAGATIDVSGTQDVVVPVTRNFVTAQLRGNELQDAPVQKGGFLQGKTVTIDIRQVDANGNMPLANVAGYVTGIGRTVAERTVRGGSLTLDAGSSVVLRQGATLDLSGGTVDYQGGYAATTTLLGSNGRVYDIMSAPKDLKYVGFGSGFTLSNSKWGTSQSWRGTAGSNRQYVAGYREGASAGTLQIDATAIALDGTVAAHTTRGINQRSVAPVADPRDPANWTINSSGDAVPPANLSALDFNEAPQGGLLQLGTPAIQRVANLSLQSDAPALAPSTSYDGLLAQGLGSGGLALPAGRLSDAGFSRFEIYAQGNVTVAADAPFQLAAGGELQVSAADIAVAHGVSSPGGRIALTAGSVEVAAGSLLSTAGGWVNDATRLGAIDRSTLKAIDAGSVSLVSLADLSFGDGSAIDVSGGAYAGPSGAITAGKAGSVTLNAAGVFHGLPALRGLGLGAGGSLSLTALQLQLGGSSAAAGVTVLPADLLARGGFASQSLTGTLGVTVPDGVSLLAQADNWQLQPTAAYQPSGSAMNTVAADVLLPDAVRNNPVAVKLASNAVLVSPDNGQGLVRIGAGASVSTDAGGSITLATPGRIDVEGTLNAPSGQISLNLLTSGEIANFGYRPQQSIWLGAGARLLAGEVAQVSLNSRHQRVGNLVNDGGNAISLNANRGFLVMQPGALLDVSGTTAVVDALGADGHTIAPLTLYGSAGTLNLAAGEGILSGATLRAQGSGASAAGGALTVNLDQGLGNYPSFNPDVVPPAVLDRVVLSAAAAGTLPPAGLQPGDSIPLAEGGQAVLSAPALAAAGFDRISLRARDAIGFSGNVSLAAGQSISLSAPLINADSGSQALLSAPVVSFSSPTLSAGSASLASVGASLTVNASLIDLSGNLSLAGFDHTTLHSRGDLRLMQNGLVDTIQVGAQLLLDAAQIYPTTRAQYTLKSSGTLTVADSAAALPAVPLSAAGSLTLSAPDIVQGGVLRAPFGTLDLEAANSLVLSAGSLTSVSAGGTLIPYGQTLNGKSWYYPLATTFVNVAGVPAKSVVLNGGQSLNLQAGAAVDLSGGGNLLGYEFVAGPGGSKDLLSSANLYAILPGSYAGAYAASDPAYAASSTLPAIGAAVYLAGGPSGAGMYTLYPAHYALLPGASAVRLQTANSDAAPGVAQRQPDGSWLVAGKAAVLGTTIQAPRWSTWQILPASTVHGYSELDVAQSDAFFQAQAASTQASLPPLAADAGSLRLAAGSSLVISPQTRFDFAAASGGLGGEVDFSAARIAVVSQQNAADPALSGYLQLTASGLDAIGAQRLVLGGTRDAASGQLQVGASQVLVQNDAAHPLQGSDLIIAAQDSVQVAAGAVLQASTPSSGRFADLAVSGDGALLRLTSGALPVLQRSGATGAVGDLQVGAGAQLLAAGSVTLDASHNTVLDSSAALSAPGLRIDANRINLGAVPAGTSGVTVDAGTLSRATNLVLQTPGSVDFYGDLALGGGTSPLQSLTLDAPMLRALGAGTRSFTAGSITLQDSQGAVAAAATGSGSLTLHAASQGSAGGLLVLGNGSQQLQGFDQVTLTADRAVLAQGSGSHAASGALTVTTPVLALAGGSNQALSAGGALALLGTGSAAATVAQAGTGGRLTATGSAVTLATRLQASAGTVSLHASAADVVLQAGAQIAAAGLDQAFADTSASAPGGTVSLASDHGNVVLAAGSTVDVSGTAQAAAGSVSLAAASGTVSLAGSLLGAAGVGQSGGSLSVDSGHLAAGDLAALDAMPASGGFAGGYALRLRTGDLNLSASDSLSAHHISLEADGGSIRVAGSLHADADASHSDAGTIALWAGNNLDIASGAVLSAHAAAGHGGRITLGLAAASTGSLAAEAGALIDVSGVSVAQAGGVTLRVPRTGGGAGSDVAISTLAAQFAPGTTISVEGVKSYTGVSLDANFLNTVVQPDDQAFLTAVAPGLAARTGLDSAIGLTLLPGVDVVDPLASAGSQIASTLDLQGLRVNGLAGVLTVRSSGNLNVNGQLTDGFTTLGATGQVLSGSSWSYRLVAGADSAAADPLATAASGSGSLTLAPGSVVRTGTGTIDLAAADNITLQRSGASDGAVVYTAGQASANPLGFNPQAVYNNGSGSVLQQYSQGGGNVSLRAGGDVTGTASTQQVDGWLYRSGSVDPTTGYFQLLGRVGRTRYYDQTTWWVAFDQFQQDIGALGGGNVSIVAGGSVKDLSAALPTQGRQPGGLPTTSGAATGIGPADPAQLLVQGGGNLSVTAQGDLLGGSYYVEQGQGSLLAGGRIGSSGNASMPYAPLLALGNAQLRVRGGGSVQVAAAYNPFMTPQALPNVVGGAPGALDSNVRRAGYFTTYSATSAVALESLGGSVLFGNDPTLLTPSAVPLFAQNSYVATAAQQNNLYLMPASFSAVALGGDVHLGGILTTTPSPVGHVQLLAEGSVDLTGFAGAQPVILRVSDAPPSALPSSVAPINNGADAAVPFTPGPTQLNVHAPTPLHANDTVNLASAAGDTVLATEPVRIYAAQGSVLGTPGDTTGTLVVAGQPVEVIAGQDISGLSLNATNLRPADLSLVQAGRDILEPGSANASVGATDSSVLQVNGPGQFTLAAGRNIDLGTSVGVLANSNAYQASDAPGASVSLYSGLGAGALGGRAPDFSGFAASYLDPARSSASTASRLPAYVQGLGGAASDSTAAWNSFRALPSWLQAPLDQQVLAEVLAQVGIAHNVSAASYQPGFAAIASLFPASDYFGNISLVYSQVRTLAPGGISFFAPGGAVDVGLANSPPGAAVKSPNTLGVVTQRSGSVTGVTSGNINVNASRIFTVGGGDILLWSSKGNIDAGKGAKSTVLVPPPVVTINADGTVSIVSSGATSGAGIGALLTGPGETPGNVNLIAPVGTVDAGDAGIRAAGNLNIAAAAIVNANNIQVGGTATGVPPADTTSLSATLPISNNEQAANQSLAAANQRLLDGNDAAQQLANSFRPTIVTVDVVSEEEAAATERKERKR